MSHEGRGGKRAGAGRPAKDPGEKLKAATFPLDAEAVAVIGLIAERLGVSKAEAVRRAVKAYLLALPPPE